jgi:hypothetical protein
LTLDGAANIGGGGAVVASSITVEVGSGGAATIVAAPAATVGAGMIVKGTVEVAVGTMLLSNGRDNYQNKKGRASERTDGSFERMGKEKGSAAERMPKDVAKKLGIDNKKFSKMIHEYKKKII